MAGNLLDRLKLSELPAVSNESSNNSADDVAVSVASQDDAILFQPPGHPKQALIDGEIWPPIFKAEYVRSAKLLKLLSTDVVVATYPKCGTTWIQHICAQLMSTDYGPEEGKELYLTSPMIERMGANFVDNLKHPRLLKTHFNYTNCPHSGQAKFIFAVRNPKDCLTSYYFHNQLFNIYEFENGDFSTFCDLFLDGKLGFGDYFDHLKTWLPHINDENVLFLKYEDMCSDLTDAVRQIGNFLGGNAARTVNNEESLARIVEESTIGSMKKNQKRFFSESALRKKDGFIRKGGSRNWKTHMTKEQSDRMDALFREKMAGTVAESWWSYEMCWDDEEAERIAISEAEASTSSPEVPAAVPVPELAPAQNEKRLRSSSVAPRHHHQVPESKPPLPLPVAAVDDSAAFRKRAATSCFNRNTLKMAARTLERVRLEKFGVFLATRHRKSNASVDSSDCNSSMNSSTSSLNAAVV